MAKKNLMFGVLALAGDKGATLLSATADIEKAVSSGLCDRDFSLLVDTGREMPTRGRTAVVIGPLLAVAESVLRAIVGGQGCPVAGLAAPAGAAGAISSLWATLPEGFALPCHGKGKKTDAQRDSVRPVAISFASVFSALISEGVKAIAEIASVKLKAGKVVRDEAKATASAVVAATAAREKADIIGGSIRAAGVVDLIRALGMFDPETIGAEVDAEDFEHLLVLLNGVAAQRAAATAAAEAAIVAAADAAVASAVAAAQSVIDCNLAGSHDQHRTVGDQYVISAPAPAPAPVTGKGTGKVAGKGRKAVAA